MDETRRVLDGVGARLRGHRVERGLSLTQVSQSCGISVSTVSRLENGLRRPTLELLLPLARTYGVGLDELVDAPATGDPRTRLRAVTRHGRSYLRLTRRPGGVQAVKMVLPARENRGPASANRHEGHQWLFVLSGRVGVRVDGRDVELGPGEVVEFDTRRPHVVSNPGEVPAEVLALFGPQGERMRVRQLT